MATFLGSDLPTATASVYKHTHVHPGTNLNQVDFTVNNISMATFLGTDRPTATAGVEQNRQTLTLVQI